MVAGGGSDRAQAQQRPEKQLRIVRVPLRPAAAADPTITITSAFFADPADASTLPKKSSKLGTSAQSRLNYGGSFNAARTSKTSPYFAPNALINPGRVFRMEVCVKCLKMMKQCVFPFGGTRCKRCVPEKQRCRSISISFFKIRYIDDGCFSSIQA